MVTVSSTQAVPLHLLEQFASIEAQMAASRHQVPPSSILVSFDIEQEALIAAEIENPSLHGLGISQNLVPHAEVCLV